MLIGCTSSQLVLNVRGSAAGVTITSQWVLRERLQGRGIDIEVRVVEVRVQVKVKEATSEFDVNLRWLVKHATACRERERVARTVLCNTVLVGLRLIGTSVNPRLANA